MSMKPINLIFVGLILVVSCTGSGQKQKDNQKINKMITDSTKQYGYNRDFLKKYTRILELKNGNSAITLVPAWQGRVMTSTSEGDSGFSFGWINHDLISSGKVLPHINAYGGEERLWLGPEGGQFSIFFPGNKEFVYENWQTPAFIDTEPFDIKETTDSSALFTREINLVNYSGTKFNLRIERNVILLTDQDISKILSLDLKGLNSIAYKSENSIINKGDNRMEEKIRTSIHMDAWDVYTISFCSCSNTS